MKHQNAAVPRGSGELTAYQRQIKSALEQIAALEPNADECVSETQIFIRTARLDDLKQCREVLRTAFDLLADRGFTRREHIHHLFRRRFTAADVASVMAWDGKWPAPQRQTAVRAR